MEVRNHLPGLSVMTRGRSLGTYEVLNRKSRGLQGRLESFGKQNCLLGCRRSKYAPFLSRNVIAVRLRYHSSHHAGNIIFAEIIFR
jgi:hypothetical protein